MRDTLRKNLAGDPGAIGLTLREVDHGLLGAPQIERRLTTVHGHTERAHIGIGIAVQKLQKQAEVRGVALVRRGGEQEQMVRGIADKLSEGIARGFAGRRCPRHAVRFIHDDQVPVHLAQAGEDVIALGEIERRDDVLVLQPLIDPELVADVAPLSTRNVSSNFSLSSRCH